MKIGVLIIGSLYWDDTPHRDEWRRERLCLEAQQPVQAPIRYGRRSASRGCSYTMVFSTSLRNDQFGRAIVIPCKSQDIIKEAECLWTAETPDGNNAKGCISAAWGRVALLENPDRPIPDEERERWTQRVALEPRYGQLMNSAIDEVAVVDQSGLLKIPWPRSEDGTTPMVNVLLATATNPTLDGHCYPPAQRIANAWRTPKGRKHVDYFCRNRTHGITTFQDVEIKDLL